MEKKLSKKITAHPEVSRYVERILENIGIGEPPNPNYGEAIYLYPRNSYTGATMVMHNAGFNLKSICKHMTESAAYEAVKNSKRFKAAMDRLAQDLAYNIASEVVATDLQMEVNRVRAEKAAKLSDKKKKIRENFFKQEAQKLKKSHAQMLIFSEGLSEDQMKALKKFHNLDIKKALQDSTNKVNSLKNDIR